MISKFLGQGPATDTIQSMRYRFLCIYCKRKKCRLLLLVITIVSISLAAMVAMNLYVDTLNTDHHPHRPDVDSDRWWPASIKVKSRMATWHWSTRRRGTVYKMDNARWTDMGNLCKSKEKYIRHKFITPGGDVTVFFSTPNDFITFDQVYKQDMWPTMHLMSQDSTLTFIDIGADDGVYSLVVAAMGNEVLAVEPNVKNVPKICQGIKASDLSGRCYVVANAVLDETDEPVLIKSRKGKSPTVYKVSRDLGGPGSQTTSIVLSDLLSQFPMEKVGIRFGLHHDVPSILNSDDKFFDKVDVQFIQMRWDVEETLHHDEEILMFMSEKGYTAYGYWESFGRLEDNIATWPENVIFRKNFAEHQNRLRSTDKSEVRRIPLPSKHVVKIEKPIKTGLARKGKPIASKKSQRRGTQVNVEHRVPGKLRLGQDLERLQYRSPAYRMVIEEMRKRHGMPPVKTQTFDDSDGSSTNTKARGAMPRRPTQAVDLQHDAANPVAHVRSNGNRDGRTFLSNQKTIDAKRRLKPGDIHARGSPVAHVRSKSIHTAPRDNTRKMVSTGSSQKQLVMGKIHSNKLPADNALGHGMSNTPSMRTSAHSSMVKRTRGNNPRLGIPRNRMSSLNKPGGNSDHRASATAIGQGQTDRKVVPQRMRNVPKNSSKVNNAMFGRQ